MISYGEKEETHMLRSSNPLQAIMADKCGTVVYARCALHRKLYLDNLWGGAVAIVLSVLEGANLPPCLPPSPTPHKSGVNAS